MVKIRKQLICTAEAKSRKEGEKESGGIEGNKVGSRPKRQGEKEGRYSTEMLRRRRRRGERERGAEAGGEKDRRRRRTRKTRTRVITRWEEQEQEQEQEIRTKTTSRTTRIKKRS